MSAVRNTIPCFLHCTSQNTVMLAEKGNRVTLFQCVPEIGRGVTDKMQKTANCGIDTCCRVVLSRFLNVHNFIKNN